MTDPRRGPIEAALAAYAATGTRRTACIKVLDGSGLTMGTGEHEQQPLASVSKLLIAEGLLRHGPSTDELVAVGDLQLSADHGSVIATLDKDRQLSLRELMALALAVSDNGIADYVARRVGFDALNETAADLGMTNTRIVNGLSDDDLEIAPRANVSTAYDTVLLCEALHAAHDRNEDRARIWVGMLNAVSGRRIPKLLPSDIHVAHKTGTLSTVCNDAGIVLSDPPIAVATYCDDVDDTSHAELAIGTMVHAVAETVTGRILVKT